MTKVTIPLLGDDNPAPRVLGTGTLFRHEDRSFLVTAAHILKTDHDDPNSADIDLLGIAVPSRLKHAELFTLGAFEIYRPKPPSRLDVVVLELKAADTIAKLDANWGFLSFDQVGAFDPDDRFILSGYPLEGAKFIGEVVLQNMLTLSTDVLEYIPAVKRPEPAFDRFFHLEEEGQLLDGSKRRIPALEVLSGASIWSYDETYEGIWSPGAVLRVVGVQGSVWPKKWFRCADWDAVRQILREPVVGFLNPP